MGNSWHSEKKRKLGLSMSDRRKEYSCGDKYVELQKINTWKDDALYASKLNKATMTDEEARELKNQLLSNFELKVIEGVDLSEKVSVHVGDITQLEIDAIVNAANNSLLGGGGVDGAIHRAAGKLLLEENKTLNGCKDGEAKLSGGYNLPAKYVMSTVGPRGEYPAVLEAAYANCLNLAASSDIKSIAFPCISTGIFGYPNPAACEVALKATRRFLEEHHQKMDRIIFCLFLQVDVDLYKDYLPIFFPSKE